MGVVKLPSGKTARVPDGLTEQEVVELLFDSLPDGPDKDAFGDRLDTSGWGETVGSVIGGLGGAALGSFAGPAGTVAGGVGGAGAGAAAGEAFEQWWSGGKGTGSDVLRAGGEGAAFGLVPGVGGAAVKQIAKHGVKRLGQAAAGTAATTATGAGIGAAGANLTGQDPRIGAATGAVVGLTGGHKLAGNFLDKTGAGKAITNQAKGAVDTIKRQFVGQDVPFTDAFTKGIRDVVTGTIRSQAGYKTGAFQTAKGALDMRRAVFKLAFDQATAIFGKLTTKQTAHIQKIADDVAEVIIKEDRAGEVAAQAYKNLDADDFGNLYPGVDYDSIGTPGNIPGIDFKNRGGRVR